jgi:hypothetical protein
MIVRVYMNDIYSSKHRIRFIIILITMNLVSIVLHLMNPYYFILLSVLIYIIYNFTFKKIVVNGDQHRITKYISMFKVNFQLSQIAFNDIDRVIIKKHRKTNYIYSKNNYSRYRIYLRDCRKHDHLILGPISDKTQIESTTRLLNTVLQFDQKSSIKKKIR